MNNKLFISCIESRIEEENSWYSRFEIGPFPSGQALTVANSLRRTLLSTNTGIFLTAVEIEGAIHEYSRLEGIKESVLDILLNLRQLALFSNEDFETEETFVGYFDLEGPLEVKAKHLKFPKKIECGNPNQHIATLTRNCSFQGRFLVTNDATFLRKKQAIGDPVKFQLPTGKTALSNRFQEKNWLYVNPISNAVRRVNYTVEQFGDVWEHKEVVVLELWTNGTIHPKQAIQLACQKLANLFSAISSVNSSVPRLSSSILKFKKIKAENFTDSTFSNKTVSVENLTVSGDLQTEKLTILFDLDIGNLNLSFKTYSLLKQFRIENIGNLMQFKKDELVKLTNFSELQIQEVEESLSFFGLTL
jgi:DNA-directed RNA polymerase subunit alpha